MSSMVSRPNRLQDSLSFTWVGSLMLRHIANCSPEDELRRRMRHVGHARLASEILQLMSFRTSHRIVDTTAQYPFLIEKTSQLLH